MYIFNYNTIHRHIIIYVMIVRVVAIFNSLAVWSNLKRRGWVLAYSARGPGFKPRLGPWVFLAPKLQLIYELMIFPIAFYLATNQTWWLEIHEAFSNWTMYKRRQWFEWTFNFFFFICQSDINYKYFLYDQH